VGGLLIGFKKMDFSTARYNMVESQVRPNGITDIKLIEALGDVERENFVPDERKPISYAGEDLHVGNGRFLLEPMVLGRLLQIAEIQPTDLVLDVGPSTGYSTAVISKLAESVVGIEEDTELCEQAGETLLEMGISNAAIICAKHAKGAASEAPFDVIVINGRVSEVPQALQDQLKEGGRLVAVIGDKYSAKAAVCRKKDNQIDCHSAFDASALPLSGVETPETGFTF